MDKEVIRNLCRWMANRYNIELDTIRIGSNQKTRLGSANAHRTWFATEPEKLTVSISTYGTNGSSEYWNTNTKVSILNTIVHEFAHLYFLKDGHNYGHSSVWSKKYHEMLASDWKELVGMYNLLAVDTLDSSFETLITHMMDRRYFVSSLFESFLKTDMDYRAVLKGIIEHDTNWLACLRNMEEYGFSIDIGKKVFIVSIKNKSFALRKVGSRVELSE